MQAFTETSTENKHKIINKNSTKLWQRERGFLQHKTAKLLSDNKFEHLKHLNPEKDETRGKILEGRYKQI